MRAVACVVLIDDVPTTITWFAESSPRMPDGSTSRTFAVAAGAAHSRAQTTDDEAIATVNIAINYIQTATEGDVICTTELDRRNRTAATLRSEVRHEDGRLMATAIGSYAIFPRRR